MTFGFLNLAWDAFSPLSAFLGLTGLAILILAAVGVAIIPASLRMPAIMVGVFLFAGATVHQAGQTEGAHNVFKRAAEDALNAERERANLAEVITGELAAQATLDVAAAQADAAKHKEHLDALSKDPDRNRRCSTHDDARRLRNL